MSQPVLIKAYGHIWPADRHLTDRLSKIMSEALPRENSQVELKNDLARISFEGIWMPLEDILEFLENNLDSNSRGKLDILDMENWKMTRHEFKNGKIVSKNSPLNNVMDYSGF